MLSSDFTHIIYRTFYDTVEYYWVVRNIIFLWFVILFKFGLQAVHDNQFKAATEGIAN